jgi:nucleotide-binding universal stress UspA family protein
MSTLPNTLVVPLDGSPFAERAVPVACALAERMHGGVILVSAPYHGPLEPISYVREVAERCTNVPVETIASDVQLPAEAILSVVGESDARTICMTSHGRGGLRWSVMGSNAEEVLRASDRPVVLVGRQCRDDFLTRGTHLLAGVDGPESATALAPAAEAWAARLGLQLNAAFVVHPLDVEAAEHPETVLDPIIEAFGGSEHVKAELLFHSYVAGVVADYAENLPAALVALNSHGRQGLARVALGSVTMAVLHQAPCPVLVTHAAR